MTQLGPRAKVLAKKLREDVEKEFQEKAYSEEMARKTNEYSTVARDTYSSSNNFSTSLVMDPSIRVATKHANYAEEQSISFYYQTVANGSKVSFPITSTSGPNPFRKTTKFSSDIRNPLIVPVESSTHPTRLPVLNDINIIKELRGRILETLSESVKDDLPGSTIRAGVLLISSADRSGTGEITFNEFSDVLETKANITLSRKESEALLISFDHECLRRFRVRDLKALVRDGEFLPRSKELVEIAFEACGGTVSKEPLPLSALRSTINGEGVLDVLQSKTFESAEEVAEAILQGILEYGGGAEFVSLQNLVEYYSDVFAEIKSAEKLETLLRKTWGI